MKLYIAEKPSLGRAIAHEILNSEYTSIVEIGAGNGSLAASVYHHIPFLKRKK